MMRVALVPKRSSMSSPFLHRGDDIGQFDLGWRCGQNFGHFCREPLIDQRCQDCIHLLTQDGHDHRAVGRNIERGG
jgi:hypothetical protein